MKKHIDAFIQWNDATGAITQNTSWYWEALSILQDAENEIQDLTRHNESLKHWNNHYKNCIHQGEAETIRQLAIMEKINNKLMSSVVRIFDAEDIGALRTVKKELTETIRSVQKMMEEGKRDEEEEENT